MTKHQLIYRALHVSAVIICVASLIGIALSPDERSAIPFLLIVALTCGFWAGSAAVVKLFWAGHREEVMQLQWALGELGKLRGDTRRALEAIREKEKALGIEPTDTMKELYRNWCG